MEEQYESVGEQAGVGGFHGDHYLLDHALGLRRVAAANGEVAAHAAGVPEANEDYGADHLLLPALEAGLRLGVAHDAPDLAVLPRPRPDLRRVLRRHEGADVVPLHR